MCGGERTPPIGQDFRAARGLAGNTLYVDVVLVCVECGRTSEGSARGWRALLTVDDEAAIFCPACAATEFGESPNTRQAP